MQSVTAHATVRASTQDLSDVTFAIDNSSVVYIDTAIEVRSQVNCGYSVSNIILSILVNATTRAANQGLLDVSVDYPGSFLNYSGYSTLFRPPVKESDLCWLNANGDFRAAVPYFPHFNSDREPAPDRRTQPVLHRQLRLQRLPDQPQRGPLLLLHSSPQGGVREHHQPRRQSGRRGNGRHHRRPLR